MATVRVCVARLRVVVVSLAHFIAFTRRVGKALPLARCRAEHLAVALVAVLVLAAHVWAGQFGIDPVDEGYFLSLADRVHQGALPYRDFDTYYTPGVFYLYA